MIDLLGHKTRVKRGLFYIVVSVVKLLTGNTNTDDQDYYDKHIDIIVLDNKRICKLGKDQLTIIQSTLWTVNNTTLEMQENQDV